MKLYNSFCYEDIYAVSSSVSSKFFIGDGYVLNSVSVLNSDQLSLSYSHLSDTYTYTIGVPDCDALGFDNSFTGISISDAYDVAWLSALVLISVWGIKVLKKGA